MGSARDSGGITPGDLSCSGTGLVVETSTNDHVVWHSNLWNEAAGTDSQNLFQDGGRLYMLKNNQAALNQIAVQIKNTSSTPVDPTQVKAQFLVAPYGSQAIQTVWAPLNVGGNDFSCVGGSTTTPNASCTPSPKGANQLIDSQPVSGTPSSIGQNTSFTLEQKGGWTPSANYICATQSNDAPNYTYYYDNNTGTNQLCHTAVYEPTDRLGGDLSKAGFPAHACMQVQLSATGVQLATKSAFRNMHQGTASLHRESALIDTRGLKKIKGQSYHDIYLYVEKKNMPYRVDAGYSPRTYSAAMQIYNRANRGCDGEFCQPGNGFDPSVPAPSEDFFAKEMPTMVVHAYADTGQYSIVGGQKVPVLTRMTSFGQFISHDSNAEGPVYGWDASLEPMAGTQFQKVGVDTYKIRIANDGAGQVVTHVEPLPTKRPVCSGSVNMNIVQLLTAIAPLVQVSPECAGEINGLIDSLQIQCVDLQHVLDKIVALDWGQWSSWVKFLVQQVETASGCKCN
jgi:hypothetical protein